MALDAVAGMALAGGKGLRARPITLHSAGHVRSKAVVPLAGRPLVEWSVRTLRAQGVRRYFVVANGRENRTQTQSVLGHGESLGVRVRYSRTRFDRENTGSGQATLSALDHWDLAGPVLVFPTDSVFDFDLAAMAAAHRASGAVVTVAAVPRPAATAAGKYGVLEADDDGFVRRFLEKPSLGAMRTARSPARCGGADHVLTNAGMYLVDGRQLRIAAREPALALLAASRLDWGGDLLPYLVARGHRVLSHPIARFGDLGNPRDHLETMRDVLLDRYPLLSERLEPPLEAGGTLRIHRSSLEAKDSTSGRTLAEKITEGSVRIGPGVRIGRDAEIGPGVTISASDVGDGTDIGEGSTLHGVACGDHSVIGPGARLTDTYLGTMVDLRSTRRRPVVLADFCALGDEVRVAGGTELSGVSVFPGLDLAGARGIPAGATLSGATDLPSHK